MLKKNLGKRDKSDKSQRGKRDGVIRKSQKKSEKKMSKSLRN